MLVDLHGELEARVFADFAPGLELRNHRVVVVGVYHDRDKGMVLCRRTQHCRTADVDVFDGGGEIALRIRDGLFERIKIHHQQIDGFDALFTHRIGVDVAAAEQPSVNLRV